MLKADTHKIRREATALRVTKAWAAHESMAVASVLSDIRANARRHDATQEADAALHRQIMAYANRHDLRTGFLNFDAFRKELDAVLQRASPDQEIATVWIDILSMRREFALWGIEAIQDAVKNISDAVRASLDEDALIGRISTNSFAFALPVGRTDVAGRQKLHRVLDAILQLGTGEFESAPDVSAGVAFFPSDADSAEDLLRFASVAASHACDTQSSAILSFQPGMRMLLMRSHLLELEIARALDHNQFSMLFQPKVDLITGKVLGAEALMRWNHPDWGPVSPNEFIPVAERSSLIHRVFDFSLRFALRHAQRWRELSLAPGIISVNASAANLRRHDFAARVQALLVEIPIAPVELELEVTETLLLDDEELFSARMHQLKAIGVRLAIDDFGTRYTGFNLLKRLPLDSMKIDQCFIRGIHQSVDMRILCTTIMAMARHMKLRTVAEGIETPEEMDVLQQIGCDAGQGYLLQRPVSPDDFCAFLTGWPKEMMKLGFSPSAQNDAMDPLYGFV